MPLGKLLLAGLLLAVSACAASRRVKVPPILPPVRDASLSELIEIVNRRQDVRTFTAKADLQFETTESAEAGVMRRYRTAQGRIILARPEAIRLQIDAPLLGVNIAEMASDGERFQLLIYPEEYRALIEGRNDGEYAEEAKKIESDPELRKAGPLVNIRPQHFTEAFLFDRIDADDPDTAPVMEEGRPLEDDDRPGAREGQQVVRSYYILTVIRRGEVAPRRKYWFDRTRGLILARQQSFSPEGLLVGDVHFSGHLPPEPKGGTSFPSEIYIERPYQEYALRMNLHPETVEVNRDIPEAAFSLEPPPEWEETLRRVNLDRPHDARR